MPPKLVEVLSLQRHISNLISTATPEIVSSHPLLKDLGLYDTVPVYVVEVEPSKCAEAIRLLSKIFPMDRAEDRAEDCGSEGEDNDDPNSVQHIPLHHLKRVRRVELNDDVSSSNDKSIDTSSSCNVAPSPKKKQRKPKAKLQLLLGPKSLLDLYDASPLLSSSLLPLKTLLPYTSKPS